MGALKKTVWYVPRTASRLLLRTIFIAGLLTCMRSMAASPGVYRLILGENRTVASIAKTVSASDEPVAIASDYEYVRQSRAVLFDTSLLTLSSPLTAGDTIILDLLSNVTYTVVIDSVSRDQFGSLSILGTIEGAKLSTVNITANDGMVLGVVQDLEKNKLFRIRWLGAERTQEVLDYDVENMPARIDLPPREPPATSSRKVQP